MCWRTGILVGVWLLAAATGHAQVGARDFRDRVLNHQRVMWQLQFNMALQTAYQNPFCPALPALGMQQMQAAYWQQLNRAGYVPPLPAPPPVYAASGGYARPTTDELRLLREAERLSFREAPGLRWLELARAVAESRPGLARQLLHRAIEEAGENSTVAQLARQELRKLDAQR